MKDIKCPNCNQMLMKAAYVKCEIKCSRCKKIITLEIKPEQSEGHNK